jgi:dolichyl-phosphate beta-glucosyltransferase
VSAPYLSIILPAHNEEHRLYPSLEKVEAFLRTQPYSAEVIVVENGSTDRTYAVAADYQQRMPFLRVIQEAGRGKGLAVRRGMLEAAGEYRIFCDVDFSMPVEEIVHFIPPALPDMDVAIASRELKGSARYNEPALRHFIGRGFNALVRWMALPGLQDTQCGFKCFRAEVAEKVFPLQTIDGWTFDVEVLYIARRMGYKIVEVPIPWYYVAESKVRVLSDSIRMFTDLVTIRRNARRGMYENSPLQSS